MDQGSDGLKKPEAMTKTNVLRDQRSDGPGTKHSRAERGKEKVEESELNCGQETGTRRRAGHSAMGKPKATTSYAGQQTQVQQREFRTYHEMYRNVTTRNHTPQGQTHIPEPPDFEIGVQGGDEMGEEGESMEIVIESGEEMMVVEDMPRTKLLEPGKEMMVDEGLACTEQSN
ncbi:hypothetical protein OIU74_016615 [Salix koriyanagi]|uniref:Uncharacterized protein n=1 Tax=Salix koriyanagi TaxID=2511006 RepID=A0A9Q0SSM2_9ROSI|nr:hypothetical protein OIU74_016615 [Salix koriyanagi]